jgi:hypothetical protein
MILQRILYRGGGMGHLQCWVFALFLSLLATQWEGDTLVVQTSDFRGDLCLDSAGDPTTDSTRTTERLRATFGPLETG